MKPHPDFYNYILLWIALSLFLIGLGIYGITTSIGHEASFEILVAGVACIFVGLLILSREVVPWIRPLKTTSQNTSEACPFCGALIEKGATFCVKCKRQLNDHTSTH